jgi:hypothetical protein
MGAMTTSGEPDAGPEPVGVVMNEAGDIVQVGLQAGSVHVEVTSEGREPVEVWLSAGDARALADLLQRAAR